MRLPQALARLLGLVLVALVLQARTSSTNEADSSWDPPCRHCPASSTCFSSDNSRHAKLAASLRGMRCSLAIIEKSKQVVAMLKMSKKQMHAFLTGDESRLISFLLSHLRRECRDLVRDIDPESLREMVVNGLVRARGHGLNSARDLTAFVSIMFEIAPNFDEQPDIRRALQDESVPRESRFSVMLERVSDEAWEEAERNRRMEAWFPELLAGEGQSS